MDIKTIKIHYCQITISSVAGESAYRLDRKRVNSI